MKQTVRNLMSIILGTILAMPFASALPAACAKAKEAVYTATAKIHGDLPEMTFSLYPTGRFADDEDGFPIWKLMVTSEDKVINDELDLPSAVEPWPENPSLNFVDINFDGYLDIEAIKVSGANNTYSTYFLWDKDQFVPAVGCDFLSSYELHPENKRIYNYGLNSFMTGVGERYSWNGTTLVKEAYYESDYSDVDNIYVKIVLNDRIGAAQTVFNKTYKADWYADNVDSMTGALEQIIYNTEYAGDCLIGTVATENDTALNVRERPDMSAKVLGSLQDGILLWLKEYDDTWFMTVYDGQDAYVMKGYVELYKQGV